VHHRISDEEAMGAESVGHVRMTPNPVRLPLCGTYRGAPLLLSLDGAFLTRPEVAQVFNGNAPDFRRRNQD
jgi:hypothetical protein